MIIPRFYRHETQFVEKGYKHDPAVGMYLEKEDTVATVATRAYIGRFPARAGHFQRTTFPWL